MKHTLLRCTAALILVASSTALAQPAPPTDKKAAPEAPKPVEKERKPALPEKPKTEPVTCTLLTKEAPRGGRLEVEGKLGKSPVVKIGGVVTRIIERPGDKIAVQIPRKSDGGDVIVRVDGKDIACGTLTIIGLD